MQGVRALPALYAAVLALISTAISILHFPYPGADYVTYRAASIRLLTGQSPYTAMQLAGPYRLNEATWGAGAIYPPTGVIALLPTAVVPIAVWDVIGAFVLLFGVLRILRGTGLWAYVLGLALALSPPMWDALGAGQVTVYLAAGMCWAWLAPRSSGWLAVLGGLVKLYPSAWLLWVVRRRAPLRWPLAAGAVLLGVSLVSSASWTNWLAAFRNGEPACVAFPPGLPTLGCWFGAPGALVAIGLGLGLLVLAWLTRDDATAFALVAIAAVLPATDLYLNYLLVPSIGVLPLIARWLPSRFRTCLPVQPGRDDDRVGGPSPLKVRRVVPDIRRLVLHVGQRDALRGAAQARDVRVGEQHDEAGGTSSRAGVLRRGGPTPRDMTAPGVVHARAASVPPDDSTDA